MNSLSDNYSISPPVVRCVPATDIVRDFIISDYLEIIKLEKNPNEDMDNFAKREDFQGKKDSFAPLLRCRINKVTEYKGLLWEAKRETSFGIAQFWPLKITERLTILIRKKIV